jgi:hypothetical protein
VLVAVISAGGVAALTAPADAAVKPSPQRIR